MADPKRMVEDTLEQATRFGQQTEQQVKRAAEQFQHAAQAGLEATNRSFGGVNRGFQAIAAEMTEYSKRSLEDVVQAWKQILRARSFEDIVEIQTRYAQRAYATHTAEMSKLTELYLDMTKTAAKPMEQTIS